MKRIFFRFVRWFGKFFGFWHLEDWALMHLYDTLSMSIQWEDYSITVITWENSEKKGKNEES